MPSTVEQLSPTRVKITVEVPFADLKPSMDKAYADIAKTVNIPGFRRGKVPPMVIDQRFGRGVIIQEAFNDSWQRFYGAAVAENKLAPLTQPDLEVTRLEDGDLIEFTAEVDIRPEFDLPDFSTISASVDALDVPDDAGRRPDRHPAQPLRLPRDRRASRRERRRAHHQPGGHQGRRAAGGRDGRRDRVHGRFRPDARRSGRGRHRPVRRRVVDLQLHPGGRAAEGRGCRHRGDGHQGPGPGAARSRRRLRPAGLGVRHDRRAAGRTWPSG